MKIAIGNDHGGYRLKNRIVKYLEENGVAVENMGCDSEEIVRYPYYANRVCRAVSEGRADRGILICSTGIGMSIAANRFRGIRASLCTSTYMGKMTRAHNDSNVLCLGGMITGELEALNIVEAWLKTPFEGGRHVISLDLIRDAESVLCTREKWEPDYPDSTNKEEEKA